ncbi:serine hydrolase [Geobacter sp. SVR]|uniref:serine hydrolase domain-containing protein n=1 Tax=Geobacter sp. SVR TaxID=2495594 RepID=UPI00143EFD5F|nr:serine hydrolase domain-containing protein [Geobacter sp. SVR]BCS52811.1 hypothetical protein GSVR_11190 [Geobacter sp. SVR]GCF86677.1 hypothetical protein GSbR_32770 [Geobacter sp. SVR]
MRRICILLIICLFASHMPAYASIEQLDLGSTTTMELLLERAMAHRRIAGCVVLVGNRDGIIFTTSRGRVNANPQAPPIDEHTIFDVASLTKVIATTSAVMKLVEDGRIGLSDPLVKWFPEFTGSGREDITILNLLTHTSGLDDSQLPDTMALRTAIQRAAFQKYRPAPGSRFSYADINFILLGELVRRASGSPLDVFCRERIYTPLGLHETMFLPPPSLTDRIAPTDMVGGLVQDLNARRLGGVAGHAGLFSSAADLARFARMLLNGGTLDGTRILSEQTIAMMTSPRYCNTSAVTRGLGWDMDSPFSAPKGIGFSSSSFGHTGYSGQSIWIDPQRNLFVILLTIRLDYQDVRHFNQLRRDISTLAGANLVTAASLAEYLPATQPVALNVSSAPQPAKVRVAAHQVRRPGGRSVTKITKAGSTRRETRYAKSGGTRAWKKAKNSSRFKA